MRDFAQAAKKRTTKRRRKSPSGGLFKLIRSIFEKVLFLFFVLLIVAFSTYIFIASVLPQFFTLEGDKNIVLIPTASTNSDSNHVDEQITIIHFFESSKMILLEIPAEELIPKKDDANAYSKSELSFNLGSIIDERLFFDGDIEINNVADLQSNLRKMILAQKEQEIPLTDLLRLYFFSKNSFVNFMIKDIENTDLSSYSMTNNNANKCAVAVINNTKVGGLAKKITQIFENSGYLVLRTDSGIEELDTSKIYLDQQQPECQQLVSRLTNTFPIELEQNDHELINRYRVGVVFLIGNDYEEYCSN